MTLPEALIAIIGAGPSGLMLARLLEISNVPYIVFERGESPTWDHENESSGTLDVHSDSGQVALREAGLLEKFQQIARYDVTNKIVDGRGNIHAEITSEGGREKPEIDRRDLRDLLLGSIPADKVRWGHKVRHVKKEATDELVSVHFTNGCVETGFHLVVGADGAWSKVRGLVTASKPTYSGIHFLTSYIKPGNPVYSSITSLVGKGNYLAMQNKQQMFFHYLGNGSYHLAVGLKVPEDRIPEYSIPNDPSALWHSILRKEFATWDPNLTRAIESADASFRSWPLYSMPKESLLWRYTSGVTLVGDAAHLSVPSGGGVNNAMYDSLELARQIIKLGIDNLGSAVREYEKDMLPRAIEAIEKGEWFAENFFGADTPLAFLQAVGVNRNDI